MRLFTRLGFRAGADEMYMHISGLAVRLSWLTAMVLLLGWSIHDVVLMPVLPAQFIVLLMAIIVYWAVYLYVQRNLTGSREE